MSNFFVPSSMHDLLEHSLEHFGHLNYVSVLQGEEYVPTSYRKFIDDVRHVAQLLIEQGWKDKTIYLHGANSYLWLVMYVAIVSYVGRCVCANKNWKEYDLGNAFSAVAPDLIISELAFCSSIPVHEGLTIRRFNELQDEAANLEPKSLEWFAQQQVQKDDTAIVVFTTGTTSRPKAVPLSLANLYTNAEPIYERTHTSSSDRYYVFLPMHHIYCQFGVALAAFTMGGSLYLARDVHQLTSELALAKPTIIPGVPLFFERVIAGIEPKDRALIDKATKVLNLFHASWSLRRRIFKKVHQALGGQVKFLSSGAAPLDIGTKKLYRDMGFHIIEGYGMSEASGIVSAERMNDRLSTSVGMVLEPIDTKIRNPDPSTSFGELLIKGGNVMKGYLVNGSYDRSAFDEDGYYATGDLARFDAVGRLYIKGRIGKVIALASGENVSIDEMTTLFKSIQGIDRIYFSEKNGFLSAEVFSRASKADISGKIDALNKTLPNYKQIRDWSLMNHYALSEMKK